MAWSRWPREGRWFLCLREGKDRRYLAWIESRDEEVLSDLFLSAVWGGAASPWFWPDALIRLRQGEMGCSVLGWVF